MKFLTASTNSKHSSDYESSRLASKIDDLQKQLDDQSREIFDLRWELSNLKYSLNPEENGGIQNALLNDVVLRNLVYFLSKKDLMSCRLVCRKWNNAILPRFRKEFSFHFKQQYGWLLIYLLIYAILLMPRVLIGSSKQ
ncbi:hypothetical protein Ocin01_02837 [Orchesella cincta]|uniref:F-box domain-containing protein n=1 Tax=Orchesella cincta TaxID=48709 RepID=A0A1D2NF20_ORCCI|nr:hypothetical protein Ocin01_02837 [Orchesella cincta]